MKKILLYAFIFCLSIISVNLSAQTCNANDGAQLITCSQDPMVTTINVTSSYALVGDIDLSGISIIYSNNQNDLVIQGNVTVDAGTNFSGGGNTTITNNGFTAGAGGQGDLDFATLNSFLATGDFPTLEDAFRAALGILPIELSAFSATINKGNVVLNWLTLSETNNDNFTIEKSYNGKDFQAIGKVAGSGNSMEKNYYSFEDRIVGSNSIYYRLKQTDFDGHYSYSNIITVKARNIADADLIYYNTTSNRLVVNSDQDGVIQFFDFTGKMVNTQLINGGTREIETNFLEKGMYCAVFVQKNQYISSIKFSKF